MNKKTRESIIPVAITIAIIIIIRIVIQIWNNQIRNSKDDYKQYNNIEITDGIHRENVGIEVDDKNRRVIKFIEYCNDQKPEKAYDLLTDDCKNEMYPTLQDFVDKYYKEKFCNKMLYTLMQWKDNTYKVDLKKSAIYTGKIADSTIQDFITVVNMGININNYVGKYDININTNENNIEITALYKNVYLDYDEYTVLIKNDNYDSICLNDQNTDKIYMTDENDLKYNAYMNELRQTQLNVDGKNSSKITIKFPKIYNTDIKIKNIVFPDITIGEKKITIILGE